MKLVKNTTAVVFIIWAELLLVWRLGDAFLDVLLGRRLLHSICGFHLDRKHDVLFYHTLFRDAFLKAFLWYERKRL